jgi:hypothetical protein
MAYVTYRNSAEAPEAKASLTSLDSTTFEEPSSAEFSHRTRCGQFTSPDLSQ